MDFNSLIKNQPPPRLPLIDDDACQPVALQMALEYFLKRTIDRDELFANCRTRGEYNFALAWGVLLGAVQYENIHAVLISNNPFDLNAYNYYAERTGMTIEKAQEFVTIMCAEARQHESIKLITWRDDFRYLPQYCVNHEIAAIPSMTMYNAIHSIILRDFNKDIVSYNDPNSIHPETKTMSTNQFIVQWINPDTDNDLILISTEKLDIDKITKEAKELYS